MYKGELISLTVAVSWTVCAMFAEVASKRMGSLALNVVRMSMSLVMLMGVMWWYTGVPYPAGSDTSTWIWLSLSGFVGYGWATSASLIPTFSSAHAMASCS